MELYTRQAKQARQQLSSFMVSYINTRYPTNNFFLFRIYLGHLFRVWGTVAGGVGKNLVQLTIDGGPPNITSKVSNGSPIFGVVYFETPLLPETFHTAVVTNLQSATNGSSEFELDRFEFITTDATPVFVPPSESASQILSSPSATGIIRSSSSTLSLRAIAGAVIGTLGLTVILLLFVLWRRNKPSGASGGMFQRKHILLDTA